jgi:hypothetical protein
VQPRPFPVESPVVAEDEVDYGRSPAFHPEEKGLRWRREKLIA